jgi:hypothetical protein
LQPQLNFPFRPTLLPSIPERCWSGSHYLFYTQIFIRVYIWKSSLIPWYSTYKAETPKLVSYLLPQPPIYWKYEHLVQVTPIKFIHSRSYWYNLCHIQNIGHCNTKVYIQLSGEKCHCHKRLSSVSLKYKLYLVLRDGSMNLHG